MQQFSKVLRVGLITPFQTTELSQSWLLPQQLGLITRSHLRKTWLRLCTNILWLNSDNLEIWKFKHHIAQSNTNVFFRTFNHSWGRNDCGQEHYPQALVWIFWRQISGHTWKANQAEILPIWEDGVLKRDFIWSLRDRYVFLFWRISNFHQVHPVLSSWFPFRDACFHHTSGESGTSFSSILRQGPIQHPRAPGKLHRQSLQKQPSDWVWLDVDKGSLVRHTLVSAYESFRMLSQEAQILPTASRWE